MSIAVIYDPRYHTFESWASLMCESFAANQLEIPNANTDWKAWATGVKSIAFFTAEGVPDPHNFENWNDWAMRFVQTYNANVSQTNANANGNATG